MELYSNVFDNSKIYQTLFMKIFTVSEYSDTAEFLDINPDKYDQWRERYYVDTISAFDEDIQYLNSTALSPEYGKIVGITVCTVSNDENGGLKRNFNNFYNQDNEKEVLEYIQTILNDGLAELDTPLICGHNILGYDIPFITKSFLKHGMTVPAILKKALNSKPWESVAVDTLTLWKFGGYDLVGLNEITTFLGLKYKELPTDEKFLNKQFHLGGVLPDFQKETANRVNLTLQLYNKLRSM
jgi:hypothetical protein